MIKRAENARIITGFGWAFAERISAQLISVILSIGLARIVAPEDYGVLAIVNVFVAIGDALVSGGFGVALVQSKETTHSDFDTIHALSLGVAAFLYGVLFIVSPLIAQFYALADLVLLVRVLGIRLFFSAINSVQYAYVQKHMAFRKTFIASTAGTVISGVIGIIMAAYGAGVWALVVQYLLQVVLTTFFMFFVLDWKPRFHWCFPTLRRMWKYGASVFLATAIDTLKENVRSLVIGKVYSSADLAFFNQGKRFPHLLSNDLVSSVGKVLLPVFSLSQDSKKDSLEILRVSVRLSSFAFLPLIFGLLGVADTFVLVFLTERWMPCVPYLRILSLAYATRPMSTIFKNSLLAVGRSDVNLVHEALTFALTTTLTFVAAVFYRDVRLVAWSYVIVSAIGTLLFSYYVTKEYSYSLLQIMQDYLPSFCVSSVMALLVFKMGRLPLTLPVKLGSQVIGGMTIYLGLASVFRMPELVYMKKHLKRVLHKGSL